MIEIIGVLVIFNVHDPTWNPGKQVVELDLADRNRIHQVASRFNKDPFFQYAAFLIEPVIPYCEIHKLIVVKHFGALQR